MVNFAISRKFLLGFVILLCVDVVLGMISGYFQHVEYFSQKSGATIISDLTFFEGAIMLFLGAIVGFYHSHIGYHEMNLIVFAVVMFCFSVVAGLIG